MSIVPSRQALFITGSDVARLLPMTDAIAAVQRAFEARARGEAADHTRYRLPIPENGSLRGQMHVLGGTLSAEGVVGVKTYVGTRGGAHFAVLLFSVDGPLLAVIEANVLGQIRTGATSGVATRFLARESSTVLGLIGAGFQARGQVEAICAVRPIETVRVYNRTPEKAQQFCTAMRFAVKAELQAVDSAEAAVREADIVVTATTSREPVLHGAWLRAGTHVNAMGSNAVNRRELDEEAVRRAALVTVDDLGQARIEAGDLLGVTDFAWDAVKPLADVVAGRVARADDEQITLFESQGLATEDLAVAHHVYQAALKSRIGTALPLSE